MIFKILSKFNNNKHVENNSFVRETWNMRCASDKTCITSSNRSESFIVTSQVSFTKIPASTTGQLSKFLLYFSKTNLIFKTLLLHQ